MESPFSFCFSIMIPYFIPSLTVLFSSSFFLPSQPAEPVFFVLYKKGRNAVPFLFTAFPPLNYASSLLNPKIFFVFLQHQLLIQRQRVNNFFFYFLPRCPLKCLLVIHELFFIPFFQLSGFFHAICFIVHEN